MSLNDEEKNRLALVDIENINNFDQLIETQENELNAVKSNWDFSTGNSIEEQHKGQHTNWCFTLNNYTEDDEKYINSIFCRCVVYGKEIGLKTGTPHLQGFICWDNNNKKSFRQVKKICDRWHIGFMRGTVEQNDAYCSKQGNVVKIGVLPMTKAGKKEKGIANCPFTMVKEDVKNGMSWHDLCDKYPTFLVKFSNGLKKLFDEFTPKIKYNILEHYGSILKWQQTIIDIAETSPNDRTIFWIYDKIGGHGKSKLADHLADNYNFVAYENAKTKDIACAWNGEHIIFDFSRKQEDFINYSVIEQLKNHRIFSAKYESTVKRIKNELHVFVFANFLPDIEAMSKDRCDIRKLQDGELTKMSLETVSKIINGEKLTRKSVK